MLRLHGSLGDLDGQRADEPELNMAPLIDMVFLLLIFFVVTTSFVKETGIDVDRPTAATAEMKEKGNVLIGVTGDGRVYLDRKRIDVRSVRAHMARVLAENPESSVVIVSSSYRTAPYK